MADTIDELIQNAYSKARTPQEKQAVEMAAKRFKVTLNPPINTASDLASRVGSEAMNAGGRVMSNLGGGLQNLWGMGKDVAQGVVGNDDETLAAGKDFMQRTGLPQNWEQLQQAWGAAKQIPQNLASGQPVGPPARAMVSHAIGAVPIAGPLIQQAGTEASQGQYGNAAGNVLTLKGAPEVLGRGVKAGLQGVEGLGKGLYESALPHGESVTPLDIKEMRQRGWDQEIPLTLGGADKAQRIADASLGRVDAEIAKDPTRPVLTRDVTQPLEDLGQQYRTSNFPEMSDPIYDKLGEVQQRWGASQPGSVVNEIKRSDNALLNDSQFRDNASPTGQKQIIQTLLTGERNALGDTYPAIRGDNMNAHTMIQLKQAAEQASKRPMLSGGMAGTGLSLAALAALHSVYPHLTIPGITLMALREAAKNPGIASRVGLSVKGLSSGGVASGLGAIPYAGYANTQSQSRPQGRAGIQALRDAALQGKDYLLEPGTLGKRLGM
jgi:hypothetical protein